MSEKQVEEIIARYRLPKKTENTITERVELFEELETIRRKGYAINDGECFSGYKTIGRTVTYPDGSILGGMAVGGPTYMIGDEFDQSMHETLKETVESLEADIKGMFGFVESPDDGGIGR